MIFLQLFLTFLKIGAVNFGGGYSMLALIENEVVDRHGWMTTTEFTDIVALSQMTPGPIGINVATYTGYTAVISAGYNIPLAVCGALLASLSVLIIPFSLMLLLFAVLSRTQEHKSIKTVMAVLRLTVIGIIAAAACSLLTIDNFGTPALSLQFITSTLLFACTIYFVWHKQVNPLWTLLVGGIVGRLVYSFVPGP